MIERMIFNRISLKTSPLFIQIRTMASKKHKRMIKLAKGYRGRANRCFTVAKQRVEKAMQYSYRDRKVRKRDYRRLWIQRINAASRIYGITYSALVTKLNFSNIRLNRKVLANLAFYEPLSFRSVIEVAKLKGNRPSKTPMETASVSA
jgi:large subunit ribosomal protein L20